MKGKENKDEGKEFLHTWKAAPGSKQCFVESLKKKCNAKLSMEPHYRSGHVRH